MRLYTRVNGPETASAGNRRGASAMKCAREGCNNKIPPNNRKYCSAKCRKIVNQKRAYEQRKQLSQRPPSRRLRQQKVRTCLGCNKEFLSEGPWNRFCQNCQVKNESRRTRSCSVPKQWASMIQPFFSD